MRVRAGKNRIVQVAETGSRKLFDKKRKEQFLEWFAATCNVRLSAGKAGVHEKTVYKHRMKDPAFADAWDRALCQGYARLEARLLQEACPGAGGHADARKPSTIPSAGNGPPPRSGEELEVRGDLDGPEVEAAFDPQLAILLLREHARRLPGSPDKRKAQRTTVQPATDKEIAEALAKRLKSFALRVRKEPVPDPSTTDGGPPPHASHREET